MTRYVVYGVLWLILAGLVGIPTAAFVRTLPSDASLDIWAMLLVGPALLATGLLLGGLQLLQIYRHWFTKPSKR